MTQIFDANAQFRQMGRLVSSDTVPFVGTVVFVPGRGDSTLAIVGLSFANSAFSFERRGNAFEARYHVDYEFDRADSPPVVVGHDEPIRVATRDETLRIDESVLVQQPVQLVPGNYRLTVRVRDLANANTGTVTQQENVPAFGPATFTAPILAYRVRARATRDDSLSIVLNSRGTVAYGGDTLLIYLEGTGYKSPATVPIQVRDQRDNVVLNTAAHFEGSGGIESRVIRLAPDSAPLGELRILAGAVSTAPNPSTAAVGHVKETDALVSFSSAWIVTNFSDLLSLLRYFGEDHRVEAMRVATDSDRVALWQEFYRATDPDPATPENEALNAYFGRIAIANRRFHEPGVPGWRTDRGEVFIVLGDPDDTRDQSSELQNAGRIFTWEYLQYRLDLVFQDVSGFGRYRLTPQSRADFDQIRTRIQHPAD